MKMAEIKRILQVKESNPDFSNRQIGKIVNYSKDTVKAILSVAVSLSIDYPKIKDLNEEEIHHLFYPKTIRIKMSQSQM